jgi:3-oxoisoapionate kinase
LKKSKNILLAFFGDDFTGSTDALEFISRAGAKTVLFTETPTVDQLRSFPGLDAFGVAGKTRSLSPAEMEKVLLPAFDQLKAMGPKHVHYKVCSTFDSSPTVGSIGKAIDFGAKIFNSKFTPVLGGMPALGRYCVFGNLFARMGTGSNGKVYRIDKHPSMSKHPVTPMNEADLRVHLGKQTNKKIGLIDNVQQSAKKKAWLQHITDEEIVLLDTMNEDQMLKIGEWLDTQQKKHDQLFSVGGSGIELALGKHWNREGLLKPVTKWKTIKKAKPLLVLAGSCSPVTKNQIEFALAQGFDEVPLELETFEGEFGNGFAIGAPLEEIVSALRQDKSVIVHTGHIREIEQSTSARTLGQALGHIAKRLCEEIKVKRVVIAGGDTSSYAARAMEIDAVEMIAPLVSGAPLCKAYSTNDRINGLEVNFKGGQVGSEDYFDVLMNGKL